VSWLVDLLGVYGRVLRRAAVLLARHWWLGLAAVVYQFMVDMVLPVVGIPFGIFGSFVTVIGSAALGSSGLVLLGHVVREGRVTLADVPDSFGVYLIDLVTFGFLLWAVRYVTAVAYADFPYAAIGFALAARALLSAVPEEIYLAGEGGAAMFVGSYQFVATHLIEWLPAALVLYLVWNVATDVLIEPFASVLGGFALAFMFVCRGLLFLELTTSSRRAREFQRRATG
jgi:hypothetical protein